MAADQRKMVPGADPGFFAGGGVNDGRVQRAPLAPAPTGGSRVDKHQIKVHSVHRIFRAIFFLFLLAIVKKFVGKKNWWSRAGGGVTTPQPPPPPPRIRAWVRANFLKMP